jgi:hypothetical protein
MIGSSVISDMSASDRNRLQARGGYSVQFMQGWYGGNT